MSAEELTVSFSVVQNEFGDSLDLHEVATLVLDSGYIRSTGEYQHIIDVFCIQHRVDGACFGSVEL